MEAISANIPDRKCPDPFIYRVWGLCANRFPKTRRSAAEPYSLDFVSRNHSKTRVLSTQARTLWFFWPPRRLPKGTPKIITFKPGCSNPYFYCAFVKCAAKIQCIGSCSRAPCFRKPIGAEAPNPINKGIWALAICEIGWVGPPKTHLNR